MYTGINSKAPICKKLKPNIWKSWKNVLPVIEAIENNTGNKIIDNITAEIKIKNNCILFLTFNL